MKSELSLRLTHPIILIDLALSGGGITVGVLILFRVIDVPLALGATSIVGGVLGIYMVGSFFRERLRRLHRQTPEINH